MDKFKQLGGILWAVPTLDKNIWNKLQKLFIDGTLFMFKDISKKLTDVLWKSFSHFVFFWGKNCLNKHGFENTSGLKLIYVFYYNTRVWFKSKLQRCLRQHFLKNIKVRSIKVYVILMVLLDKTIYKKSFSVLNTKSPNQNLS